MDVVILAMQTSSSDHISVKDLFGSLDNNQYFTTEKTRKRRKMAGTTPGLNVLNKMLSNALLLRCDIALERQASR